ncbi:MAG: DUF779 domain-containing protein [Solirubrobacterales bacterium]
MGEVTATPEAEAVIERLREQHGPLVIHQSGGCCDGSAAMCLRERDLPPGPNDVRLGTLAGAPFLVDREMYRRWREPDFHIDVVAGAAESFSLEGPEGVHFVNSDSKARKGNS